MTKQAPQIQKDGKMSAGQKLFCLVSALALALTFIYSDAAIASMSDGMRLCVSTLIPSLFPFMVLSELFVRSGAAELVGKAVGAPLSALLGISREGGVAWLLGALCGFPIGMRCAISLYEKGKISRAELEHLSTFCNSPSSAFLIGAVGASLLGSQKFGVLLYSAHLVSSLIVGFAGRFYFAGKKAEYCTSESSLPSQKPSVARTFSESVSCSATSMLFICAFVLFFSSLTGILKLLLDRLSLNLCARALIFGFLEMTGGVFAASELPLRYAIPVIAAITGWSGLSVHFQLVGICGAHKLSFLPYFLAKIASSLLCCALTVILTRAFADGLFFSQGSVESVLLVPSTPSSVFTVTFFIFSCLTLRKRARGK